MMLKSVLEVNRMCSIKKEKKGYGFAVEATVKSIRGKCMFGHKVGDKIVFDGSEVKGKICYAALIYIMPIVYAFAWGAAEFPWDKDKDVTSVPCLDAENSVVFELQRDRTKFLHIE
jgi:uncharacterized repeat protein (TIGR04076 family)